MITELTVPLSERVEFVSTEWISEVQSLLEYQSELRAQLRAPFSFSACYRNPPPHLNCADGLCGYVVRIAPGSVSVLPKPNADVSLFVEHDYNAALPLAWTVHGDDDDSFSRSTRAYAHLALPEQRQGTVPDDPALHRLLLLLHDHMAIRTLNNPDIQHRIQHQGLTNNVAQLDEFGFTILENAFTDEFADALRAASHDNVIAAPYVSGGSVRRGMMNLHRGRLWEQAAIHPWVLTLADHLLGRGCLIYQSSTIVKAAGQDTHPGLHNDYGASAVPAPYPEFCLEATAVWAIDEFDEPAGPTVLIPESFKKGQPVPPGTTQDDAIALTMNKGSIGFWHGASWHGAMPRTAPGERTSLHNAYCRGFVRPLERYEDIDAAILDRNPPIFTTLCGLDDALGKSTVDNTDFERMAYTSQHGYGSSEPLPELHLD